MKIRILLIINCIACLGYSQKSPTEEVKAAITKCFQKWANKSEFESTKDHEKRLKKQQDNKLKFITDSIFKEFKERNLDYLNAKVGIYDADNQTFPMYGSRKVYINYSYTEKNKCTLYVKVPINVAPKVKDGSCINDITIIPKDAAIIDDIWTITQAWVLFNGTPKGNYTNKDDWKHKYFEHDGSILILNNQWNYRQPKKNDYQVKYLPISKFDITKDCLYYLEWKLEDQPNYNSGDIKSKTLTVNNIDIQLPQGPVSKIEPPVKTEVSEKNNEPRKESVEDDLIFSKLRTKTNNGDAIAVIIGNKDYKNVGEVKFAINDSKKMKEYLINILGYKEGNIFYYENATKSVFETCFGTKENYNGKLSNAIKPEISDVFIYYSGHGAPGLKDKRGYFVPIDCDPQYLEQGGYSLDLFQENITKVKARNITVVIDACFSGSGIHKNISPINVSITIPITESSNCVFLSSSSDTQVSSWYNEKGHGLFTYFYLKAHLDKYKSDKNGDNKLTFQEAYNYISDKTEGVPYFARRLHGVDQNPTIQGAGKDNVLIQYK